MKPLLCRPAEAIACGSPVISSRNNGGADMITQGFDGFVLDNAEHAATLADILSAAGYFLFATAHKGAPAL
jgi:glycosyltransferase involved in cell wall biosynthesis